MAIPRTVKKKSYLNEDIVHGPAGRRWILGVAIILAAALFTACGPPCPDSVPRNYRHVVILGDPHLPGRFLSQKEQVRATINAWRDVDLVVSVGDICHDYGSATEYAAARAYYARLHKPLAVVTGNHDYFYATPSWPGGGGYLPATRPVQEAKLALFRQTFHLPSHYYSQMLGGYHFVFLSADHETFSTGLSEEQITWLRTELARHSRIPTILVFHGPLQGTQHAFKQYINRPHSVAQPVDAIHGLITANPQVFLWISGHTHTPPTEASYASPVNVYAGQVTNIHNTDMKRETIWTNSLLLYPDRVVVRTFNHGKGSWQPELERTIRVPRL